MAIKTFDFLRARLISSSQLSLGYPNKITKHFNSDNLSSQTNSPNQQAELSSPQPFASPTW